MNTQCSICCNIASYRWVYWANRKRNSKSFCQSSKTLPTLPPVFVVEGSRFSVLNTSCSIFVLIARACALSLSHFITCHFTTCHFTTCDFTTCHFTTSYFTTCHFTTCHFTTCYSKRPFYNKRFYNKLFYNMPFHNMLFYNM